MWPKTSQALGGNTMGKTLEDMADSEDSRRRGVSEPEPDGPRRQIIRPAIKAVVQFARFMITLPVVLIRGRRGNLDEVTVYSATIPASFCGC